MHDREIQPYGCAECGREKRSHGNIWSPVIGLHLWIAPDDATVLTRMRVRRDR